MNNSHIKNKGMISSLPWRNRFKIRSKALWTLCPASLQGALIWLMLGPLMMASLVLLSRLDTTGYSLHWGGWGKSAMFWTPALIVSSVFLPACRGIVALRFGGLWVEYFYAIKGQNSKTMKKVEPKFEDWALYMWMWVFSVFGTWLQDREMRHDGLTLSNSLAWHAINAARIEICAIIFLTLIMAWFAKSGVFALESSLEEGHAPKAKWTKAMISWQDVKENIRASWLQWKKNEKTRWKEIRQEVSFKKAWFLWWGSTVFPIRAMIMAVLAESISWGGDSLTALWFSPEWVNDSLTQMSFGKFATIAVLAAVMARIMSKRVGDPWSSSLWFGPSGPSFIHWMLFGGVGIIIDRMCALRMDFHLLCQNSQYAGGGFLVGIIGWMVVVWSGDLLIFIGGCFGQWIKESKEIKGPRLLTLFKWCAIKIKNNWKAAGRASAYLVAAVEKKALENEEDLSLALKKELQEAIPDIPVKRSRSNRL